MTKPLVIAGEKKHLSSVLFQTDIPSLLYRRSQRKKTAPRRKLVAEFKSTAVLPYVQGVSEPLRLWLKQKGIRIVFKCDTKIQSHLVRPKDNVDPAKRDGAVYRIPCECGKVFIRERDIRLARRQTSTVSEYAYETGCTPIWNKVKCSDRDPHWFTRRVKKAIHMRLHLNNINGNVRIKIPEAWMPTIKNWTQKKKKGTKADRWGNSYSPDQWSNGRIEMHQSQPTFLV